MIRFLVLVSLFVSACGSEPSYEVPLPGDNTAQGSVDMPNQELGLCSTSPDGTSLTCTGGQTVALPPAFPNSKDCNQCISKVEDGVVKVKCPNGLNFEFVSVKGEKGDTGAKGDKGDKGSTGTSGKDGSSCSVTADGWVRCTDGTSYKLLQGPKGDTGAAGKDGKDGLNGAKGDTGVAGKDGKDGKDGVGCTLGTNNLGQTTITCGNKTTVIDGCGGGGCWSFGAPPANVYALPANTSQLQNSALLGSPIATNLRDNFADASRDWTLGMPGTTTTPTGVPFTRTEWYQVEWNRGFIDIESKFISSNGTVTFELIADDGAIFEIIGSDCIITVVDNDFLHPPQAKTGTLVVTGTGKFMYSMRMFQGPRHLTALKLSMKNVNTGVFETVSKDSLTYLVK